MPLSGADIISFNTSAECRKRLSGVSSCPQVIAAAKPKITGSFHILISPHRSKFSVWCAAIGWIPRTPHPLRTEAGCRAGGKASQPQTGQHGAGYGGGIEAGRPAKIALRTDDRGKCP